MSSIIDYLKAPSGDRLYPVGLTKAIYDLDGNSLDTLLSNINAKFSGYATASHTHNYAGSSSAGGAATSAVKLSTARTITLTGGVTGSGSFDGSANLSITTTLASHTHTKSQISDLTITNNTSATAAIAKSTNVPTMNTLANALNRTTGVSAADTNYTTYMARAIALVTSTPSSMNNGTCAFVYT